MVCYNLLLVEERKRKRKDLLQAPEKLLARIVKELQRRKRKPLRYGIESHYRDYRKG
jgi:hypothetical protein